MSELLLDALMQLFALLTDINKEQHTGRANVLIKDYLERQFNAELAQKYFLKSKDLNENEAVEKLKPTTISE